MEVKVLDEIPFSIFEHMEIEEISNMVQNMIISHVKEHITINQEKYIGKLAN